MKTQKDISKYLKVSMVFILVLILNCSCQKDDPLITDDSPPVKKEDILKYYSPEVSFEITSRLLEGKAITCIEPNYKGNTWIASGRELYFMSDSVEKTYTLDYPILDISIAGDETLWIATDGGGLGHLSEEKVKWFNKANSGLPRDYIRNVEVGLDGRVWFSSGAHDLGGLVVYDGTSFDLFTPDNSILNQHVIGHIGIDHNGSIYVSSTGKVGRTNVYRITDDFWECLGDENGTFYWVPIFSVGPAGIIYLYVDYSLSSSFPRSNSLFEFRDSDWENLEPDFMSFKYAYFTAIKSDRRDYCWAASIEGDPNVLHVYNGISWEEPPEELFFGDGITTIETDMDNNIWVGTAHNGVFILKQ